MPLVACATAFAIDLILQQTKEIQMTFDGIITPRFVQLTFPCGLTAITTHGTGTETDSRVLYSFTRLYGVEKGPSKFHVPTQVPALFVFEGDFNWHTQFFALWALKAQENDRIERFRKVGVRGLVDLGIALIPQLPPYDVLASKRLQDKFENLLSDHVQSQSPASASSLLQLNKLAQYQLDAVARTLNV